MVDDKVTVLSLQTCSCNDSALLHNSNIEHRHLVIFMYDSVRMRGIVNFL